MGSSAGCGARSCLGDGDLILAVNNREEQLNGKSYLDGSSSLSTVVVESSTVDADVPVRFLLVFLGAGGGFSAGGLLLERKTCLGVESGAAGIAA